MENKYKCEKCNCSYKNESMLIRHEATELHKQGKRKIRCDKVILDKCPHCEYTTKNVLMQKQHILIAHSTKEEREEGFKYYCKYCDFGTFAILLYNRHNECKKHKQKEKILNSC